MKVPLRWLAEYVDLTVEPRKLADDLTLVGLAVDAVEGSGKDAVLDIDVTTNRVDCMNVYGVAREVSVLYDLPLRPLALDFVEAGEEATASFDVEVAAGDLCPRFCARVLDVRLGPSPSWLRDRLEAVGVRSINNVVDLTNYVMMETGHPSHAFDLEKVPGRRLVARWAREGERLTTLDGLERVLGPRHGLVACPEGPLAVAGVMGGGSSEVSDSTRVVALEAAYWDPLAIRRAARSLGMHTEASHRFERGADPEAPPLATARIAHLLGKIGAGTARPGLIDRRPVPTPRRSAVLRPARLGAVLGAAVPSAEAERVLAGLGFAVAGKTAEGTRFEVPTWRQDVSREVDLVEEVGRHHGLHRIAPTLPPARRAEGLRPWQRRERALRDCLVGAGLSEAVNYAFVDEARCLPGSDLVRLANPLAEDLGVLRPSLLVPGLLRNLVTNLRQGRRDVRLFEIGRVFFPGRPLPGERRHLGLAWAGAAEEAHWSRRRRPVDFHDAKGLLEALGDRLEVALEIAAAGDGPDLLHPGQWAAVRLAGTTLGALGTLHPDLVRAWELKDAVVVAEIDLEPLLALPVRPVRAEGLPRFPATSRDLSLVVDAGTEAAVLEGEVRVAAGAALARLAVVDRYEGPPVPAGKVSLTLGLTFQGPERTLTGEEVQSAVERVVAALRQRGVEIRGV